MSIKLLHFADLHLGVENYGKLNPKTGLNTRFEDFVRTLNWVIDEAIRLPADIVIFAGDAYKSRDPSPTHQQKFAAAIQRLSAAGIPTLLLVGNHDLPNTRGRASSIDVYQTLKVPYVIVADAPATYLVETPGGPVQIIALPYRRISLAAEKEEYRDKTRVEIAQQIDKDYEDQIRSLSKDLNPALPTVLTAHLSVAGSHRGSECAMMLSEDPSVMLSALIPDGISIDYVALGHIHRNQNMNAKRYPPVVYSGSLERVDFGEESDVKGYMLVNLEHASTTCELQEAPVRRFVTIKCDLKSDRPMEELQTIINQTDITGAVVRLHYTISEERWLLIQPAEIHRMLGAAFCVGKLEREVLRNQTRSRDPILTDSLDIYHALERFSKVKKFHAPVDKVLEAGKAMIEKLNSEEAAL